MRYSSLKKMARFGRQISTLKSYLPDATTILICLLAVGTVLRGVNASKNGEITFLSQYSSCL